MSMRFILFAAWCAIVFSGSVASSYYAWSPFADGKRGGTGFFSSGPYHK